MSRLSMSRRTMSRLITSRLSNSQQLDLEDQCCIGRYDAARAARAVAERGRNGQLALAADLHALHALVPALDHAPGAEWKHERIVAVLAGIELRAVGEPAGVVNRDALAGGGSGAGADSHFFDDEA